jgi:hypothetical protein
MDSNLQPQEILNGIVWHELVSAYAWTLDMQNYTEYQDDTVTEVSVYLKSSFLLKEHGNPTLFFNGKNM